jgi:hypothetical protein
MPSPLVPSRFSLGSTPSGTKTTNRRLRTLRRSAPSKSCDSLGRRARSACQATWTCSLSRGSSPSCIPGRPASRMEATRLAAAVRAGAIRGAADFGIDLATARSVRLDGAVARARWVGLRNIEEWAAQLRDRVWWIVRADQGEGPPRAALRSRTADLGPRPTSPVRGDAALAVVRWAPFFHGGACGSPKRRWRSTTRLRPSDADT